ncbi:MAG: KpsF/GutQ family sugar-phosphate isomerase [Chthoniobacterales bacterium]|nr:KpsF/GutQ family sugar-phosphate isomerase [Chthoniobacterales bacterium]MCX7713262.1 KpsF/GutQ family sugar-phosphate isomerase [Chthoniobacterales bacterium]
MENLSEEENVGLLTASEALRRASEVFSIEISGLRQVSGRLGEDFLRATRMLLHVLQQQKKIVVLGVGKSGLIGQKIAATLTSTGAPAVVLNSVDALHGDIGVVSEGDVVLALSYSGQTQELLNVLPALASFGVQIIAITGNTRSDLARAATIVLDVSIEKEACPLGLAPTSSTTAMLVLGDALAMVILEARGFRKEDFARFHPGGSIGRQLLVRVADIMRPAEQIPIVDPDFKIMDVISEITRHRAGAAVIVDEAGRLAGIFTLGDFARCFPIHADIASRKVGEFMTKKPVSIRDDRLAAEVLHVLRNHRVDDLVVVDNEGKPVGLVDSQDLSRLKIL